MTVAKSRHIEHLAILEILSVLQEMCIRAFERDDMMKEEAKSARKQFKKIDGVLRREWGLKETASIYEERTKPMEEVTAKEIEKAVKVVETPAFLEALGKIK